MNRLEDNKDGLKLLFDGMPVEKLSADFNFHLMERMQTAVQKRTNRREKLDEILLLSLTVMTSLTGLFLILRYFNHSVTADAVQSTGLLGTVDIRMPDVPSIAPLFEYMSSPMWGISIFITAAIFLLLVLDYFMRKEYANRHSIEL